MPHNPRSGRASDRTRRQPPDMVWQPMHTARSAATLLCPAKKHPPAIYGEAAAVLLIQQKTPPFLLMNDAQLEDTQATQHRLSAQHRGRGDDWGGGSMPWGNSSQGAGNHYYASSRASRLPKENMPVSAELSLGGKPPQN